MEPLHKRGVVTDELGFDCLDGASRFQEFVMGLVDNSHPAFTEAAIEHILTLERDVARQRVEGRTSVAWTLNNCVVVTAKTVGAFSHVG